MTRIFLIGYMGSGKTTIGKILAAKMGYSFIDMDKHIEEKTFKTVSQIFSEQGEAEFRQQERDFLHEVSEFDRVIVSTGGGAPCFFDNMEYMNARGITIYLKLTPAQLANRLETSRANKRPLLAGRKGEELIRFITDTLEVREPFYNRAAFHTNGSIDEIVSQIYDYVSRQ